MKNIDSIHSSGGKANSLVKLKEFGFPVPPFEIVPFEVFREAKINNFLAIPKSYQTSLFTLANLFSGKAVAVRSSASKEDGASLSFAGLFETYLNIEGQEAIAESILKCWKSTSTERTATYCQRNKIDVNDLEMAVVVQEYIEPDFAGVIFTVNPINGNDQEMIIEACPGSGEKLVSGLVNPSRFHLSRDIENFIILSDDRLKIAPKMTVMKELQIYAMQIQARYGTPQDIEFAVKNNKVYILQSRPITKIQFGMELGEWTTSDFRDGGVSSAVVSPIMWSLYEKIFASTLPEYFTKLKLITIEEASATTWYKVFYGRPYWNLRAVKNIQETLPGYNERNFDQDMALPVTYEGDGVTTGVSIKGILKALPVLGALHKEYALQRNRSLKLIKEFNVLEERHLNQNLASMSLDLLYSNFKKLILTDYTYVESEYFQTIYNASNAKLEFSDEFKFYKKIDPTLELVNLLTELGELKVTGPAHFLLQLARDWRIQNPEAREFLEKILEGTKRQIVLSDLAEDKFLHDKIEQFNSQYYFHSERELDLLVPRWGEDLRFSLETLKSLLCAPSKAHVPRAVFDQEMEKLKAAHMKSWRRFQPGSFKSVLNKLERIRNYLWLREEVRDRSTRVYYFIRKYLLEISERTKLHDLVFYLSYQDLLSFIDQKKDLNEILAQAERTKLYAQGFKHFKNSNEIGFNYNQSSWQAKSSVSNGKTSFFGIGCSAGVVRAKACVIKDISEASKLNAGDLLVVPFTDPGWTPLFSLASGVVTETGGLLSHAALISREYGIPCVLNVNGATDLVPHEAMIEIDGNRGSVTLL